VCVSEEIEKVCDQRPQVAGGVEVRTGIRVLLDLQLGFLCIFSNLDDLSALGVR